MWTTHHPELGFDWRDLQITLPLEVWAWVDAHARKLNTDAAEVLALLARIEIEQREARYRYDLTPKGEASAAEPEEDAYYATNTRRDTEW